MSPSAQRALISGAAIAALISFGIIGYKLFPAWFSATETGLAHSQPLPAVATSAPRETGAETSREETSKETTEGTVKTVKAAMTPAATPAEEAVSEKEPAAEKTTPDETSETPAKPPQAVSENPPVLPEIAALSEKHPVRPYEEMLPGDVYEPPAIKVPTRKPKPPKARRIRKDSVKKPVRSKRLDPIARSQLPPWKRFAVRIPRKLATENADKPKIVIVIDDLGIDTKRTEKIIALPGPLTLSFLTYAKKLNTQTIAARKVGHEIMLHVAMEPADMQNDPGPNVLLKDLEPDELARRLVWGLGRLRHYVGINNHMGSKFTEDRYGMTIVMTELHRRGLLFLDSRTTGKSVGAVIAHAVGVPYAERNIFLDNVNKVSAIQDRLAELEGVARRKGRAIAIGHPRDATIEALSIWLKEVRERGFAIVPITAVVHVPKLAG